jgi:hypothetical protein
MKVFVSWSGKYSKEVANILKTYIPCMLQGLDVFMSQHDLESGERWSNKLANELSASDFGIICLSDTNLNNPWILFEAGALTKQFDGKACSLLLNGLSPTDVSGPLSQFQNKTFTEEDVYKLICDLNKQIEPPIAEVQLKLIFDKWYPDILAKYNSVTKNRSDPNPNATQRDDRSLLEEILTRVRGLDSTSQVNDIQPDGYLLHVIDNLSIEVKNVLMKALAFRLSGDHQGRNNLAIEFPDEVAELVRNHLLKVENEVVLIKSEVTDSAKHWLK